MVPVGGVSQRFQRLLSGDAGSDATLLSGGFETRGQLQLPHPGSVREVADPYVGAWAAATGRWLSEDGPRAAAFAAAYQEATAWCFDRRSAGFIGSTAADRLIRQADQNPYEADPPRTKREEEPGDLSSTGLDSDQGDRDRSGNEHDNHRTGETRRNQ
ncbi:MAG TPA: hypothetical protein VF148_18625 [Acidimicrobiia bacterium]